MSRDMAEIGSYLKQGHELISSMVEQILRYKPTT